MRYTTDLTDTEWNLISYCFPKPAATGRPRKHAYRELLNAIFYLLRTGCQWRNLPKDLPPWPTVYDYFGQWERSELIEEIHAHLRDHLRLGEGRKRHILVDTLGLLLLVTVLPANVQDRDGARQLLAKAFKVYGRLRCLWADGGYAGQLVQWVTRVSRCALEIVHRSNTTRGFIVLPRRWVVERTFGWLGRSRRLSRDYQRKAQVAEAFVYLAMCRLMLHRWVKN